MIESWGAAVESGFCFTSSAVSEIVELGGGGSLFSLFSRWWNWGGCDLGLWEGFTSHNLKKKFLNITLVVRLEWQNCI